MLGKSGLTEEKPEIAVSQIESIVMEIGHWAIALGC
jgi:hypothetical protein